EDGEGVGARMALDEGPLGARELLAGVDVEARGFELVEAHDRFVVLDVRIERRRHRRSARRRRGLAEWADRLAELAKARLREERVPRERPARDDALVGVGGFGGRA